MRNTKILISILALILLACVPVAMTGGNIAYAADVNFKVTAPINGEITATLNGAAQNISAAFPATTGDRVVLTPVADEGYKFMGWDTNADGKVEIADSNEFVVADANITVAAVFKKITYVDLFKGNKNYSVYNADGTQHLKDIASPSDFCRISGADGETKDFIIVPGDNIFIRWAQNTVNGPDINTAYPNLIVLKDTYKNENGLITKYKFSCTFDANNHDAYCALESASPVKISQKDNGSVAVFKKLIRDGVTDTSIDGDKMLYLQDGDDVEIEITIKTDKEYYIDINKMTLGSLVLKSPNVYTYTLKDISLTNISGNIIPIYTGVKTYDVRAVFSEECNIVLSKSAPFYKGDVVSYTLVSKGGVGIPDGSTVSGATLIENANKDGGSFTIDGTSPFITITANPFKIVVVPVTRYTVEIRAPEGVEGFDYTMPTGGGTYEEGADITLVWTESPAIRLLGWDELGVGEDGKIDYNYNPNLGITVTKNMVFVPIVEVKTFEVVFDASKMSVTADGTKIASGAKLRYGSGILLNTDATNFNYWTDSGNKITIANSTNQHSFSMSVTSSLNLAYATKTGGGGSSGGGSDPVVPGGDTQNISINISSNNSSMGNISSSNGTLLAASNPTTILTATPKDGYIFVRWEKNGENYGTTKTIEVTDATNGASYVAVFQVKTVKLYYTPSTAVGGTWEGTTTAAVGSNQVVKIVANKGYIIDSIKVNGEKVDFSGSDQTSITLSGITSDQSVVINFKKTGLSDNELIIVLVTIGLVVFFAAALTFVLVKKPNQTKLQRLISARRSAMEIVGDSSTNSADNTEYEEQAQQDDTQYYDNDDSDEE